MPRQLLDEDQRHALFNTTLGLVNRARAAFDMKPLDRLPKGNKGEPQSCPLALALDHGWSVGGADVEGLKPRERKVLLKVWADELDEDQVSDDPDYEPEWIGLPAELGEFVDRFDSGEFPDLIERP